MLKFAKLEQTQQRRKLSLAFTLVFLMLASSLLALVEGFLEQDAFECET